MRRSASAPKRPASALRNRKDGPLTLHDVGAVQKKITVLERKAVEKETQRAQLQHTITAQEGELEELLISVADAQKGEHELFLRVVEARLLNDALLAQQVESAKVMTSHRTHLHDENGNRSIKEWTVQHLTAIRRQREATVAEMQHVLAALLEEAAEAEAEAALLTMDAEEAEEDAVALKQEVARQAAQLSVVVDSVGNALKHVERDA